MFYNRNKAGLFTENKLLPIMWALKKLIPINSLNIAKYSIRLINTNFII